MKVAKSEDSAIFAQKCQDFTSNNLTGRSGKQSGNILINCIFSIRFFCSFLFFLFSILSFNLQRLRVVKLVPALYCKEFLKDSSTFVG